MIINDIGNILKQKYPEFGYGIFFLYQIKQLIIVILKILNI